MRILLDGQIRHDLHFPFLYQPSGAYRARHLFAGIANVIHK